MAKDNSVRKNIEWRIASMDLMHAAVHAAPFENALDGFDFRVESEIQLEPENDSIIIIVNVFVQSLEDARPLGAIGVAYRFEIANFAEVMGETAEGIEPPRHFLELLNTVAISSTRGVMFSQFRGTYLHTAILPIVDPRLKRIP